MNLVRARRVGAAALLAFVLSAGPSLADVKLRIYLQDGALQAGTLVTETPKSFVILTGDGRVEVPKSSIMFINGKTLKQWQDRPDKLFQTEIMPSEVPDPSFVNDKSLPPVPSLPSKTAAVKPPAPVKPVSPVVTPKVAPPAAAEPPVAPARKAPAVATPPEAPAGVARREARKPAPPAVREKAVESVGSGRESRARAETASGVTGAGRFDRAAAGLTHRERARDFARQGEQGRAWQEYEIARLMEPGNPENPLALARICLELGVLNEARRHFSHPLLRRNAEAREQIQNIGATLAAREKALFKLRVATIAASFAWLPVVVVLRMVRRRRKAIGKTTILADDLLTNDELQSPVPAAEAPIDFTHPVAPSFEETVELAEAPTMLPAEEPAMESWPDPVVERPSIQPAAEEPVYAEEAPVEAAPFASEVPVEPDPEPEPMEIEEPVAADAPEPVFASAMNIPPPDPEEILSVARTVEASLMRANQRAMEGRLEEARRSYRTALALNPSCASAHLGLGYVSFVEERWETSLLHYRKALDIDAGSADAHYGIARVLLEINRVEDALPELRATLQIDPTYDDARDTLTALSKPA